MTDELDRAADLAAAEVDHAVAAHAARKRPEPADNCADCDDDLEPHRKEFGTCYACQSAREIRARIYRT